MTIGQIIEEGLISQKIELSSSKRLDMTYEILKDVGLSIQHINRYPHEFSGGQRQRIAIARAIILRPKLLILDEPTSSMDTGTEKGVIARLKQWSGDRTVIMVTHRNTLLELADRVLVIDQGQVVADTTPEKLRAQGLKG